MPKARSGFGSAGLLFVCAWPKPHPKDHHLIIGSDPVAATVGDGIVSRLRRALHYPVHFALGSCNGPAFESLHSPRHPHAAPAETLFSGQSL